MLSFSLLLSPRKAHLTLATALSSLPGTIRRYSVGRIFNTVLRTCTFIGFKYQHFANRLTKMEIMYICTCRYNNYTNQTQNLFLDVYAPIQSLDTRQARYSLPVVFFFFVLFFFWSRVFFKLRCVNNDDCPPHAGQQWC